MIKGTIAICLALLCAKTFCETSCPLTTTDGEIVASQSIKKMNGTWTEYRKSAEFLTKESCITYNIKCSNDTTCLVDLIQNGSKTISNTAIKKVEIDITWGDEEVYIHLDDDDKYALIWTCEGEETKSYQIAALVDKITNETSDQVDDIIKKINVAFKSEPKVIDHKGCSGATMLTMNLAVVFIALLNLLTMNM